jgi:hypothetical protein
VVALIWLKTPTFLDAGRPAALALQRLHLFMARKRGNAAYLMKQALNEARESVSARLT